MDKNELQLLAQKYLDGNATTGEKQLLDQWYDTIHTGGPEEVRLNTPETEEDVKHRMFNKLNQQLFIGTPMIPVKKQGGLVRRISIWAASAAAVLAVALFAWSRINKTQVNNVLAVADKQVISIPASKVMHVTLSDGSKVWLNAGTVFRYPKTFNGKNRVVELVEGRAFFDIRHQSAHPFIVITKNLNITVLGTSFDVRSYKSEGITKVSVVTGKVGITRPAQAGSKTIMLLPKQEIVLSNSSKQIITQRTPEAVVNSWCNVFEQESLSNVFKTIEKEYHIKIYVEDEKLLRQPITITLDNQHLDSIMKTLSFTKHFNYQMANDSTVIIK